MKIKTKLFIGFVVIGIFITGIGGISILEFENSINHLNELDNSIKKTK